MLRTIPIHTLTVYTSRGFLTWHDVRGCVTYTPRLEDAATFDARGARDVARAFGGCVVTTSGALLTVEEVHRAAHQ